MSFARRTALCSLAALGLAPAAAAHAAVTPDPPEKVMLGMLEATKNRAYEDFLAEGNDELKAGITKQMFEGVCGQVSDRLAKGYKIRYLSKLRKEEYVVYLWKLEFADAKDECLLVMSVKDKKVAGILMQ